MTPASSPRPGERAPLQFSPLLLVAPVVLFYAVFLIWPMAGILASSLTDPAGGGPTLRYFVKFLTDDLYLEILLRTARLSLAATVVLLLIAYPAASYLYFGRSERIRHIVVLALLSPLLISGVVRALGWSIIFYPGTGVLASIPGLEAIDLHFTEQAIVIGYTHFFLPYMTLAIYASLSQIDRRLFLAASSLGAGLGSLIRDILLPLTRPGAVAGATLTFALSAAAVMPPIILGGAANKTMPYLMYQRYLLLVDYNFGATISVLLLLMTTTVLIISARVGRGRVQEAPQ